MSKVDHSSLNWFESQYNTRLRIPEYSDINDRWLRESSIVRDRGEWVEASYGADSYEKLDIFPSPIANSPVLVFIHGGYWRLLDKRHNSFIAKTFVDAAATVVLPNYALCPGTSSCPVNIEHISLQMVSALAWIYRNISSYHGDCKQVVVVGHSAGGHLASMLLSCDWKAVASDLPRNLIRSAIAISGLFDLKPIQRTPSLQVDLRLSEASIRRLSPIYFPRPKYGQLYLAVGSEESGEFKRQSALLQKIWGTKAVPIINIIKGVNHLTILDDIANSTGELNALTCKLLGIQPKWTATPLETSAKSAL